MNNTVKKQNRILLITIILALTAATVLVVLVGTAGKKSEQKNPPLDATLTETDEGAKNPVETKNDREAETADTMKQATEGPDAETEQEKDKENTPSVKEDKATSSTEEEVTPVVSVPQNVMPTLTLPLDAAVQKGFSGEIPVFSYTMNDYRTHGGVDFICVEGTTVKAAADGTVCELYDDPMMGVTVAIRHGGGAVTRYRGLSEESLSLLTMGETVKRGQPIGSSGTTALIESAEEPHVHFELEVNGVKENPGDFLKLTYLSEITED